MLLSCLLPSTIFTVNINFAFLNVRSFLVSLYLWLSSSFMMMTTCVFFNPVADLLNFSKVWSLISFINFGKYSVLISSDISSILFSVIFFSFWVSLSHYSILFYWSLVFWVFILFSSLYFLLHNFYWATLELSGRHSALNSSSELKILNFILIQYKAYKKW